MHLAAKRSGQIVLASVGPKGVRGRRGRPRWRGIRDDNDTARSAQSVKDKAILAHALGNAVFIGANDSTALAVTSSAIEK